VKEFFHTIPPVPSEVRGATAIARMVDGLGFRYRWSLEGLNDDFLGFRPSPDSMNVNELLVHIHFLATRVHACFVEEKEISLRSASLQDIKNETLEILHIVREQLVNMSDEELAQRKVIRKAGNIEFPFWNFINGPVADALTHVGQINTWRRIAGYPPVKADVFTGQPPAQTGIKH
jgi:hypothetical protein